MKRWMLITLTGLMLAVILIGLPAVSSAQGGHGGMLMGGWTFHGDNAAHKGLVRATAVELGLRQRAVAEQLKGAKSISSIVGTKRDQVLARYDAIVDRMFDRAVASGKLPASLADARRAWFKRDARLMIDQPGLKPSFPGLHELHMVIIKTAVTVTGAPHSEVVATPKGCGTIADVATKHGKTPTDVVNAALAQLDGLMDGLVKAGKLTTVQRDGWHTALQTSLTSMMSTPGLHVAGKQCAK